MIIISAKLKNVSIESSHNLFTADGIWLICSWNSLVNCGIIITIEILETSIKNIIVINKDVHLGILKRDLILPHPRMHTRNFVLFPLFEINKNWKHPILKKDIKILICSLSNKDIRSIKLIWFNDIISNAKFWRVNK